MTPNAFESAGWKIRKPEQQWNGKTVVVPTIHPYGDQRVIRCAQALLDHSYGVHLIWPGGEPGVTRWSEALSETRLGKADSTLARMRLLPQLAFRARTGRYWHIHDYYMLPFALGRWLLTRRPTLYDVHEYYPEYYSSKVPSRIRPLVRRLIGDIQLAIATKVGGVNAAAPGIARPFQERGIPTAVTPNYPDWEFSPKPASAAKPFRVVYVGSLNNSYGQQVMLETARLLSQRRSPITIDAIAKFSSAEARETFRAELADHGRPVNIRLLDPVASHQLPGILAQYTVGLSFLQPGGQNELAVPTKLYEYVCAGLAIVASDLRMQRDFLERHAIATLVEAGDAAGYADALQRMEKDAGAIQTEAATAAQAAASRLSWRASAVPSLQEVADRVFLGERSDA